MVKRGLKAGDNVEWAVGYCDFYHGWKVENAPYDIGTEEYNRWIEGWNYGDQENRNGVGV